MPHLTQFTSPKSRENNERGFNLFSKKDLVEASGTCLSARCDSRSAGRAPSRAGNGQAEIQRFSHSGERWLLGTAPACASSEHRRCLRHRLPALLLPRTPTPPEMPTEPRRDCASSPLNISTFLFCSIQQEQNQPEVTGLTWSRCLCVKLVLLAAASAEATYNAWL